MSSRAVISLLSILILCCMITASGQRYLLEHLAIMLFGMAVGLVATFYLGENEDMMLLEFNQESFFVMLAPPIFLEAGYNMNRRLFFDHSHSIFMFGIVGTYVNAILFATCFYLFVSYIHPCGLMVGESFTMEDAIHLAALIAPTDVVAVLSIFKNIPSTAETTSLISIVEGESLINDGVGIVLFWHTGQQFPDQLFPGDWGKVISVVLVPLIFLISILGGSAVALLCAFTTTYSRLQSRPQVEFLIVVAFAYLSYFVFAPIPVCSEFISLFSCGFALAHYNEEHLSEETRLSTRTLFKSWGWVAETFIFFQIGVNSTVSLHDETWAWTQSLPTLLLVLALMIILRFVVVYLTCFYLNYFGYENISWKEQVVLNIASVRGAVSYALCLVWPTVANSEAIHTTTLGVVLFTNFIFGSALGPVVHLLFPPPPESSLVRSYPVSPARHFKIAKSKHKESDGFLRGSWREASEDLYVGDDDDLNESEHGERAYKALSDDPGVTGAGEKDWNANWIAQLDKNYIRPFFAKTMRIRVSLGGVYGGYSERPPSSLQSPTNPIANDGKDKKGCSPRTVRDQAETSEGSFLRVNNAPGRNSHRGTNHTKNRAPRHPRKSI
eukprot:CAMPEP_0184494168 /NCGR_PEP_ID=MMETSP0113_2-20130426/28031_1 /TAXON_ID=91329 /ORGANISM="Norrisiella sphaerica, Strain BC52" /LENGTH=610 /DNA_ID=CAMNT_0026879805 /DNA_START=131 /DNA_END=1963 /DNA_ORIENTATION=-